MNKEAIVNTVIGIKNAVAKHSPEILTGIGIAGMVSTVVLAVRATPKAEKLILDREIELSNEAKQDIELNKKDRFKIAWKCYIPTAITGAASIACIVSASSVNFKRNTALAAAYNISATALAEYKDKVVETIGEKKEHLIKDKIAEDRIEKNPVSKNEVIITGRGTTICYDSISGRYFKSDMDRLKKAENELNRQMLSDMYISLNEFYDEIGLDHISIGDDLGWNIERGMIDLSFSSLVADDGTPCLVVDYQVSPKFGYSDLT